MRKKNRDIKGSEVLSYCCLGLHNQYTLPATIVGCLQNPLTGHSREVEMSIIDQYKPCSRSPQARPLLRAKGGCIEPKPPPAPADGSYCEQINPFLYHVTFIKTADKASSRGDAYVKWVYKNNNNKMVTTSAHFALPEVRGKHTWPLSRFISLFKYFI